MEKWSGKIAVVTGASSGIGAQLVKTLAEHGIIVVGLARREDKVKDIAAETKGTVHAIKCDVSKEEDVLNAFRYIESSLGGVDILINNAGISTVTNLSDGATKDFKNVLDINVLGLCMCTKEALKSMRRKGDNGHIIHINSVAGHRMPRFELSFGTYIASKHAVTALTEGLRLELHRLNSNIKVTSISPGAVYTEMADQFGEKLHIEMSPARIKSMLNAQDIVDGIIYALGTRPGVQVHDIMILPLEKPKARQFD